jgi:hypothetical protein
MRTNLDSEQLIHFVEQLYDMHALYDLNQARWEEKERCQRWMDAVLPPPVKEEIEIPDERERPGWTRISFEEVQQALKEQAKKKAAE